MAEFINNLKDFLLTLSIPFEEVPIAPTGAIRYSFQSKNVTIVAVPLSVFDSEAELHSAPGFIFVFEDRWQHSREAMEVHIKASLGLCNKIFARNCAVRNITAEQASAFLGINHIYGDAKSKYRYGLFRVRRSSLSSEMEGEAGELVAVASFSAPRNVTRTIGNDSAILSSYEWVRYASLMGVRVIGGMGKLLKAFIDKVHPQDIMSYADLEWSDGNVYKNLGFKRIGEREPVKFIIDPISMDRISMQKIERDKKYLNMHLLNDARHVIHNVGSSKWVLTL